ncbi:WD40 repeat-like protein [Fomitopsis serialis]|uniref:WD40 repeat-like protein n=1 Tax=Fomitopsis serialis TaxID=139415 RepID=UPI0020082399|nr:WD40 repeat-like protein [Neoantrodia serialis]KAH9917991.1 WD40 repeat-like protein [Neoantrodia serialis]
MPDSFFAAPKTRKRKRSQDATASSSRQPGRSVPNKRSKQKPGAAPTPKKRRDEELSDETHDSDDVGGIDEMDLRAPDVDPDAYESGEEDEEETPAEKRLRLAKMYLDGVKQGLGLAEGEVDAAEIDRELISTRLKQDVLEHSGKVHLFVADSYQIEDAPSIRTRGHRFSVTGAVASPSARWLFTSGKEGAIIKWDLHTGRKVHTFLKCRPDKGKGKDVSGHTDEVWALAVSPDGRYLASGGKDRRVGVWDVEKNEWVKGFTGHRDHISALAFRKVQPNATTSTQLYSGSFDRTLKLFDLTSMGYVETLFGHQAPVLALDALRSETAVSAGGRDKTVRFWKIPEETQLVFRGGGGSKWRDDLDGMDVDGEDEEGEGRRKRREVKGQQTKFVEGSIECIAMIDEVTFVSGGDSGSLSLWTTQKKKPVFTQALAHGIDEAHVDTEDMPTVRKPRWVTAIGALRYSDLFASGSWDGSVRLWKLDAKLKSFALLGTIPAPGVVNSIQFCTPAPDFHAGATWARSAEDTDKPSIKARGHAQAKTVLLVAGVGHEMRFGRWVQRKGEGVLNGALVVALHPRT